METHTATLNFKVVEQMETQEKKRVLLLLRDSTLKQDISMQRIECTKFCGNHPDWTIIGEITEEGVSGFKKSAKQRDGLQDAQERAINGEYDILLVFMFDRIGRIESESPFIVKWFVLNGIEVWSTQEGQQKFENHTDNLINFLRFWQAEGESLKISIRTRTKSGQMVEEGRYRGGPIPYGYKIEKQGRINRKGYEVHEIVIDEFEADIVRQMYAKVINEGYGTRRIAGWLNDQGIKPRNSAMWINTSIQRILRNIIYLGILKSGATITDIFEHLQIVDIDAFDRVQKILDERKDRYNDMNTVPLQTKGKSLLSGNLFCGHCGLRMVQSSNKKTNKLADGSKKSYKRLYYKCFGKSRFKECDGQTTYSVTRIDDCIETLIHNIFEKAKTIPSGTILNKQVQDHVDVLKRRQDAAQRELNKKKSDMAKLESELLNVITGQSVLSREMLNNVMEKTQNEINAAAEILNDCALQLEQESKTARSFKQNYDNLITWANLFDTSSHEEKQMILSGLIKRIDIFKDSSFKIEFAVSYKDLFENLFAEEKEKAMKSA